MVELQRSINLYIYARLLLGGNSRGNHQILQRYHHSCLYMESAVATAAEQNSRSRAAICGTRALLSWSTRSPGLLSCILFCRHCSCTSQKSLALLSVKHQETLLTYSVVHSSSGRVATAIPMAGNIPHYNCSVDSQSLAKGSTKKHGVKFHNDLTSSLLPFALLKINSVDF